MTKDHYLSDVEICNIIKTYLDEDLCSYAVLIDGEWGCGKTYFVQRTLKNSLKDTRKMIYVSLYGIRSVEELKSACVDAVIIEILYRNRKQEQARGAISFVQMFGVPMIKQIPVIGEALSNGIDNGINERGVFLEKVRDKDYFFVFDDLERCCTPIGEVLGYINHLIEQTGSKVLLVTNEKELGYNSKNQSAEQMLYQYSKEKLVGQTIRYGIGGRASINQIIEEAAKSNLNWNKEFIEKLGNWCKSTMDRESVHNLRILQNSLAFYRRIYGIMREICETSEYADRVYREIMNSVLTVMIRARTTREKWDIRWKKTTRYDAITCLPEDNNSSWSSYFLSFRFVHEYIECGVLNEDEVRITIQDYLLKLNNEQMPNSDPYIQLSNYSCLNEEKVEQAYKDMEQRFIENKYGYNNCRKVLILALKLKYMYGLEYIDLLKLVEHWKKEIMNGNLIIRENMEYWEVEIKENMYGFEDDIKSQCLTYFSEIKCEQEKWEASKAREELDACLNNEQWCLALDKAISDERIIEMLIKAGGFVKCLNIEKLVVLLKRDIHTAEVFVQINNIFRKVEMKRIVSDVEEEKRNLRELIGKLNALEIHDRIVNKARIGLCKKLEEYARN